MVLLQDNKKQPFLQKKKEEKKATYYGAYVDFLLILDTWDDGCNDDNNVLNYV